MIVTDINISKENLDSVFMNHRDGIDPENYRVGVYNDKIYVLNPSTGVIMEYFYDDRPEQEWFDISNYYKVSDGTIPKGTYFINRSGELYSKFYKRNLKINTTEMYPNYGIKLFESINRSAHSKRAQIHILLSNIFIPNPDPINKIVVDHINHDKFDYNLSNLRWATIIENINNKVSLKYKGDFTYFAYYDEKRTQLAFTLTEEELYNHGTFSKSVLCRDKTFRHYGYYWDRKNNRVSNYLRKVGIEQLDDTQWKETRFKGIFAHPSGLIKNRKGYVTEGSSGTYINYRSMNIPDDTGKYSQIMVHVLIAETFLNNNNPLEKGQEVDHISSDSLDNRVENLRICNSHSENMKNQETRKKLSRRVRCISDGIIHGSIKDCVEYYGLKNRFSVYNHPESYEILDPKKK